MLLKLDLGSNIEEWAYIALIGIHPTKTLEECTRLIWLENGCDTYVDFE